LFSNTLSFLSSHNVSDPSFTPIQKTGKIIVLYILIFKFLDSNLEDRRLHLPKPLVHSWWRDKKVGGRSHVPAPLGPTFTFISMLVTSDQAWLSTKPPSLLKLFLFRCISIVSIASRSSYPDVLSNIEVPIKSIIYPLLMMCFATAEFSG
jgi:hypothetical protein